MSSDESKIIFLPERSSICHFVPKIRPWFWKQEHVYFWPTLYCTF